VKERVCAALDMHGKCCRKRARPWPFHYHGDSELYGTFNEPWPGWVRVYLCEKHSEPSLKERARG
jgi:hypothetical protein